MKWFLTMLVAASNLVNPYRFVSAPSGNLVTFEGTGVPALWTDGSTGNTVDWDYTASPLVGAQSLYLADPASGDRWAYYTYAGPTDQVWAALWYKENATPAVEYPIIEFLDASDNALASVRVMVGGNVVARVTSTNSSSVITLTNNTAYRIKARYVRGTGSNETLQIWVSTDASGAWSATQTLSNGASTVQATKLSFYNSPTVNVNMVIDNVLVKSSDITWTEIN